MLPRLGLFLGLKNLILIMKGYSDIISNEASLEKAVLESKMFDELGLNKHIQKIKMIEDVLKKKGDGLTLASVFNKVLDTAFNEAVGMGNLDKEEVIEDKSINKIGAARIRINHFIKMIKEHNSSSKHTLKITQTLLANGLTSGKRDRIINLDMIKASDRRFFVKGTNSNRKAIKRALLDYGNFSDYNNTLSDLSTRKHNIATIKELEVNK